MERLHNSVNDCFGTYAEFRVVQYYFSNYVKIESDSVDCLLCLSDKEIEAMQALGWVYIAGGVCSLIDEYLAENCIMEPCYNDIMKAYVEKIMIREKSN